MNRRDFLAIGAAALPAVLRAQTPAAPMPPPPAARITSSVMLWPLKGSFEDRVSIAARAGMQSIELLNEYASWDDAAMAKAKKFVNSFSMGIDAIVAGPDLEKTIAAAQMLNCPQVILRDSKQDIARALGLAEKANLTLVLEFPNALTRVKEADTPHLRLAINLNIEHLVKEAADYTAIFHIDPTASDISYKEIYQAIQKSGYSRYVAMEYTPAGNPVASLIQAVDSFRAALVERPAVTSN
jgi:hydroxypyruvate isomerase